MSIRHWLLVIAVWMPTPSLAEVFRKELTCPPSRTRNCTIERCSDEGGCARCCTQTFNIPGDHHLLDVRFFQAPKNSDRLSGPVRLNENLEWAKFTRLLISDAPDGGKEVKVTFMNWSDVYTRKFAIEVVYIKKDHRP
jgi:hypothetical protein